MDTLPRFFRVKQRFEQTRVADVPGEVREQMKRLRLAERLKPGQTVAIGVGSRGIANLASIVRTVVEVLQSAGAQTFVTPAMGSHGGASAEGQLRVLEDYGLTESFLRCPIRSSMETVEVALADEGFPILLDRQAFEADHFFVVNRVKPHTGFSGEIESGLLKMLLLGLGKHAGATIYHRAVQDFGFQRVVRSAVPHLLATGCVLGGLAIVENAYDETAQVAALMPDEFFQREAELLVVAKGLMARLPFREVDLLMIDEIGKNISGTGMDTNVIGRKYNDHKALADEWPKVKRIYVRGLASQSHGNALGIGMAEFCHKRVLEQIDLGATRVNSLTSCHMSAAKLPLDYPSDREAVGAALPTLGLTPPEDAKGLWIRNTLALEEVECSEVYLQEARGREDLEILTALRELRFDAQGDLLEMALERPASG